MTIEGVIFGQIDVRSIAKHHRRTGLTVAVDEQDPVPTNCKMLCEVQGESRLANAPFEVRDRDHRGSIRRRAPWACAEYGTHVIELCQGVLDPVAGRGPVALGEPAITLGFTNCGRCPPDKGGGLRNGVRRPNLLPGLRIERTVTDSLQDGERLAVQVAKTVFQEFISHKSFGLCVERCVSSHDHRFVRLKAPGSTLGSFEQTLATNLTK